MKFDRNFPIILCLVLGLCLVFCGVAFKITHHSGAEGLMIAGLLVSLIYAMYNNQLKYQLPKIIKDLFIVTYFALGGTISLYAGYLKITRTAVPVEILVIGGISTVIFIMTALGEIFSSRQIKITEKIMWTICLVVLNPVAGLFYLLSGRTRIMG